MRRAADQLSCTGFEAASKREAERRGLGARTRKPIKTHDALSAMLSYYETLYADLASALTSWTLAICTGRNSNR